MVSLYYCVFCKRYTLHIHCPHCHKNTINKQPPRFSPQDAYGSYRRKLKKQQKKVND
ncbi:MAG: ribosome biogenesis protein [Candidatus Heimdallarchaeota archaeon]|nr:ribosome biogenesis protein [Candidatus Heimdallarchaeota archaeon]